MDDESSEGTLDRQRGILDVERRKESYEVLPLHYKKRGVVPHGHAGAVKYYVEERVIRDGESLFVFGDVSGISVQSGEGTYRAVRGSPTLGGVDAAPIVVYAGNQKGLVAMLAREERFATGFAVVALGLCGAMALSLGALAML